MLHNQAESSDDSHEIAKRTIMDPSYYRRQQTLWVECDNLAHDKCKYICA